MSTLSIGCAAESSENLRVPAPDVALFEAEVYPLMLRDCGFVECHGSTQRFFQVFGPGRTRLNGANLSEPALPEELAHTYDRARSMLAHKGSIHEGLLLLKPLAVSAGGAGHEGQDVWGQDVYPAVEDERFQLLFRWAASSAAELPSFDGGVPAPEGAPTPQTNSEPEGAVPPQGAAPEETTGVQETPSSTGMGAL